MAKTKQQGFDYLSSIASRSEICTAIARDKLRKFFSSHNDSDDRVEKMIEEIIEDLTRQGFIDDNRFLPLFVRYKIKFDGWGPRKIENKLLSFDFSKEQVDSQLLINKKQFETLKQELIEKKKKELEQKTLSAIISEISKIDRKLDKEKKELSLLEKSLSSVKENQATICNQIYKKVYASRQKISYLQFQKQSASKKVEYSQRQKLEAFLKNRGF